MGIPLMVIGLTASKWLPTSGNYLEVVKELFGFIMIGLAVWIMNPFINQNYINQIYLVLASISIIYFLKYLIHSVRSRKLMQSSLAFLTISIVTLNIYNTDAARGMDRFSESFHNIESSEELGMRSAKVRTLLLLQTSSPGQSTRTNTS